MPATNSVPSKPEQDLDAIVFRAQQQGHVLLLLEDMAPDLLRINRSAAETAARIMLKLRASRAFPLGS